MVRTKTHRCEKCGVLRRELTFDSKDGLYKCGLCKKSGRCWRKNK